MKLTRNMAHEYRADGVQGHYTMTRTGQWVRIHHVVLADDGIGCKNRVYVGSVSAGNYDPPRPNPIAFEQAEGIISAHARKWVGERD